MNFLIFFIGAVLLVISVVFKLNILFMVAFLVAVFNDFIGIVMIQKKQDERAALIKSKTDGLTYFIIFGLVIIMLGISVRNPEIFKSVPQLLSLVLTVICLVHSFTLSIFQRKY